MSVPKYMGVPKYKGVPKYMGVPKYVSVPKVTTSKSSLIFEKSSLIFEKFICKFCNISVILQWYRRLYQYNETPFDYNFDIFDFIFVKQHGYWIHINKEIKRSCRLYTCKLVIRKNQNINKKIVFIVLI